MAGPPSPSKQYMQISDNIGGSSLRLVMATRRRAFRRDGVNGRRVDWPSGMIADTVRLSRAAN